MKKTALFLSKFLLVLMVLYGIVPNIAFATTYSTKTVENKTKSYKQLVDVNKNQEYVNSENNLPNVTIDQASAWADKKGFEVIRFLQRVVNPISIVIFIACAFMTLFGVFGKGTLTGKGIIGMITCAIVYVVVTYAPDLMAFFLNWVRS